MQLARAAREVHADDLILHHFQVVLQGPDGSRRCRKASLMESKVASRPSMAEKSTMLTSGVGTRTAMPSSRACQVWQDLFERPDGLRGRGDHAQGGGPGPPQIPVGEVQDALIVCVGMHRGDEPVLDAEGLVEDLGHGSQAVGGTAGIADDPMRRWVEPLLVHPHHDGQVGLVQGIGDQHLAHAPLQEAGQLRAGVELARAFQDDLGSQIGEGRRAGFRLLEDADLLPVQHAGNPARRKPGIQPGHGRNRI